MDLIAAITSDDLPALLREDARAASTAQRRARRLRAAARALPPRPQARDALLAAGAPVGPLEAAALGDVERAGRRRSERPRRRRLHAAAPGRVLRRRGRRRARSSPRAPTRTPTPRTRSGPPAPLRRRGRRPRRRVARAARGRREPERRASRAATRRCTPPRTTTTPSSRGCCSSTAPTRARPTTTARLPRDLADDAVRALLSP